MVGYRRLRRDVSELDVRDLLRSGRGLREPQPAHRPLRHPWPDQRFARVRWWLRHGVEGAEGRHGEGVHPRGRAVPAPGRQQRQGVDASSHARRQGGVLRRPDRLQAAFRGVRQLRRRQGRDRGRGGRLDPRHRDVRVRHEQAVRAHLPGHRLHGRLHAGPRTRSGGQVHAEGHGRGGSGIGRVGLHG